MERLFIILLLVLCLQEENEAPRHMKFSFMSEEFASQEKKRKRERERGESDSQNSAFFNNKNSAIWSRPVLIHHSS